MREEDEFIFEYVPTPDEEEEAEDLQSISADQWGEDIDWDDAEELDSDEDFINGK